MKKHSANSKVGKNDAGTTNSSKKQTRISNFFFKPLKLKTSASNSSGGEGVVVVDEEEEEEEEEVIPKTPETSKQHKRMFKRNSKTSLTSTKNLFSAIVGTKRKKTEDENENDDDDNNDDDFRGQNPQKRLHFTKLNEHSKRKSNFENSTLIDSASEMTFKDSPLNSKLRNRIEKDRVSLFHVSSAERNDVITDTTDSRLSDKDFLNLEKSSHLFESNNKRKTIYESSSSVDPTLLQSFRDSPSKLENMKNKSGTSNDKESISEENDDKTIQENEDDILACLEDSPLKVSPEKPRVSKFNRKRISEVRVLDRETRLITEDDAVVVLRGSWCNNTILHEGDIINVLSTERPDGSYVVDDLEGLVVVNPDYLVSGTCVVASLFCMRKAVLGERYKGLEGTSKTMFVGTVVHELLQGCLKRKVKSLKEIDEVLEGILKNPSIILDMATLQMTTTEVKQEVNPFIPHVMFFIERYLLGHSVKPPNPAFASTAGRGTSRTPPPPHEWSGQVTKVCDIEENIWSPRLGLKGKVDLTVEVKLTNRKDRRDKKILPLELKTGRASSSAEHKGQVILYSMMMSERREDPESGLLLYLRNSSLQEIKAGIHEMRGLIQLRNQLVAHLSNTDYTQLPEPINLKNACEKCAFLVPCTANNRKTEEYPESHAMSKLIPESLKHLNAQELEFFHSWNQMVAIETRESKKKGSGRTKNMWLQTPEQRMKFGYALANLKLIEVDQDFRHRFRGKIRGFDVGESVVVSTESALALSQGTVLRIDSEIIEVALDRNLSRDDHEDDHKEITFIIDKYEYVGGSASSLVNLAKLMADTEESKRLRSLIIENKEVSFVAGLPKDVAVNGKSILKPLNRVQQKAVFKTLMAKDYVLLKGMPGTGKTTLIVALVRLLSGTLGKSVLVTGYTNSSVDNILLKLNSFEDADFVRLGRKSRIHPDLYPRMYNGQPIDDVKVVGTTCLTLNHPLITNRRRRFDYCILDEAGQSLLLPSLGPLFHSDIFVLVGDPKQLPPVVTSSEARSMGMNVSIFSRLEKNNNVIPLTVQYRMNSRIMDCANVMTYEGALECSSIEVGENVLSSNHAEETDPTWMQRVLNPALDHSVIFLDTNGRSPETEKNGAEIMNPGEASIISRLLNRLRGKNYDIGVIAPYRAQVTHLKRCITCVEINTVDQFQGRDKDVIFYSCTRSNLSDKSEENALECILNDERRLNVALTRAKRKIIVVGNKNTLLNFKPFKNLIKNFLKDEFVIVLDEDP